MNDEKNAERPLHILHIEDSPRDAEIILERLTDAGFSFHLDWATNEQEFTAFLQCGGYDLILADYRLPAFDGTAALQLTKSLCPGTPFICVSGAIGEEKAVELLKQGATDYVLKKRLDKLPLAMQRALDEVREQKARQLAEADKEKLEAQNQQLQKTESLGRMAGAIAHHFNNQLQAVMGNLEMAMDDLPLGVNPVESLVSAMQAAHKAAVVSGLMLTYLGQTQGNHEPIDLSEACRQSLTLLQAAAPKGMILKADFPSCGPVIRANAGHIHQVLTNLITNAWEAAGKNNGAIVLTVKMVSLTDILTLKRFPINWQPKESVYTCMEVTDEGHGIQDSDIEKIFDPFFTTKFTGRGLGLSVVLGIVGAHGGGVTVESKPGRGSVFRVFLPVSTEEVPCLPDLPAMSGALQTGKAEKFFRTEGGGAVLLVEDDEQVRNMTRTMLTRLGYTVIEAKDGVKAVELFKQHQGDIHCVLSDVTMPFMDGWETLTALRSLSPGIPVVLSSGYDEAQIMAGEHPEHPNAFLSKPYQIKGLGDAIRRAAYCSDWHG